MPGFPFLKNPPAEIVKQLYDRSTYHGPIVKRPWLRATSYAKINEKSGFILTSKPMSLTEYNITDNLYGLTANQKIGLQINGEPHELVNSSIPGAEVPGVEGVSISTGGDNGLLWQGTLKTKWSTRELLEYAIPYFATPGIHIAVEWGWISNMDNIYHYPPPVIISVEEAKKLSNSPYAASIDVMKKANGNYGVCVAIISDFRISGNEVTGYVIETEFMSKGTNLYDTGTTGVSEEKRKSAKEGLNDSLKKMRESNDIINNNKNSWLSFFNEKQTKSELDKLKKEIEQTFGGSVRRDITKKDDDNNANPVLYISLAQILFMLSNNTLFKNDKQFAAMDASIFDVNKLFPNTNPKPKTLSTNPEVCVFDFVNKGLIPEEQLLFSLETVRAIIDTATTERDVLKRLFEKVNESTLGLIDLSFVNSDGNVYRVINKKQTPPDIDSSRKLIFSDTSTTYIRVRESEISTKLTDYMKSQVFFEGKLVNGKVESMLRETVDVEKETKPEGDNDIILYEFKKEFEKSRVRNRDSAYALINNTSAGTFQFTGELSKYNSMEIPGTGKTWKEWAPKQVEGITDRREKLEKLVESLEKIFKTADADIDYSAYPNKEYYITPTELKAAIAKEEKTNNKTGRYPYFGISYEPEIDGIAGLNNGDVYYAHNLPIGFGNNETYFFITGVEHNINQMDWTTKLKSLIKL